MEPMPKMSREEYLAAMRAKMEAMLGQVADAINNAPDGYIIAGSEEKVNGPRGFGRGTTGRNVKDRGGRSQWR